MSELLPQLGAKGRYAARAPFDTQLNPQLEYNCIRVASIKGLIAEGLDPFELFYKPAGLTDKATQFEPDLERAIVSLQAGNGSIVHIPSAYLTTLADADGVPYRHVMLGVSLSAVPQALDLQPIMDELRDLVLERLGVKSTVKAVALSSVTLLSHGVHKAMEQARLSRLGPESMLAKAQRLQGELAVLHHKYALLENWVKQRVINAPPP